jgi:serine/threonine protein kinase
MEYACGGELFNYIVNKRRLEETEASFFFVQIITGLEYIHKNNIVHRDMKPENLLLTEGKILKIIDFGLSNSYRTGQLLSTPCGSPCYAAPEMILGRKYSGLLVDTWSTGIILYAMVCGYLPFEDKNNERLYNKILECKLEFPEHLSFVCKDLIKKILTVNPSKRIKLEDIKHHPFLKAGEALKRSDSSFTNAYNEKVFEIMSEMGFDKADVKFNLDNNKHNNTTTTYDLLVKKQRRLNPEPKLGINTAMNPEINNKEKESKEKGNNPSNTHGNNTNIKSPKARAKETFKFGNINLNNTNVNTNENSKSNTNSSVNPTSNSTSNVPNNSTVNPSSTSASNSPIKKITTSNAPDNRKNINININCKNKIGNINININEKEHNDSGIIIVEEAESTNNKETEEKMKDNVIESPPQVNDQIDTILNTFNNTLNTYESNTLVTETENETETERKHIAEISEILDHGEMNVNKITKKIKDNNIASISSPSNRNNTSMSNTSHVLNTSGDKDTKTERTERFNRAAYLSGKNKNSIRRAKIAVSMSKSRPAKGTLNAFNAVNNTLTSENPNNNSINLDITSYLMKNKYESNNIILPTSLLPTVNRIGKKENKFLSFNLAPSSPSARSNTTSIFNRNTINTSMTYEKSSSHEFNTFCTYRHASPDLKSHSLSNKFVPSNTIDLMSCNINSTEDNKSIKTSSAINVASTPTNTSFNTGNDFLIRNKYFGKFNSINILGTDKFFNKRSLSHATEESRSKTECSNNPLSNAVNNVNIDLVDITKKNGNNSMRKLESNVEGNANNNSKTNVSI